MKNLLLFTYLFCITLSINAQDLVSKIPKDAKAVVAIKGKNITDLVSVSEFENSKMGQLFLEEMLKETDGKVTNLNELGIDLKRNFYYFMTSDTLGFRHNFLVPLKNKTGFESLMPERQKKKIITDGDLSYFVDPYDSMVTMWNNNSMLLTIAQETNNYDTYGYNDYNDYGVVEEVVEEAAETYYPIMTFKESEYNFGHITEGDVVEHTFNFTNTGASNLIITDASASCGCTVPSYPETPIYSGASGSITVKFNSANKSGEQNKTITISANTENGTERLKIKTFIHPKGTKIEEETIFEETDIEETVIESDYEVEETVIESTDYNNDYYEKRQKEREAKQLEYNEKLVAYAKATMAGNYANGSILNNTKYVKAVGKGKDEAFAWVGDVNSIYSDILKQASYGLGSSYLGLYNGIENLYSDMSITSRLNFGKTQATLNTSYTMNDNMAKYTKAMYDGKMNSNFFNYFNEDKMLGYFAINASTKGILETYPEMMTSMFENYEYEEVAAFIPIGMRVLSLLIDEEGAAQILRGDMLFVLTEMKERELSYTTYEYDENYERTEVTKTKNETLPGFLMMVTSSEGDIFNKLMNIAVKESRGEVTLNSNGIYELTTNELPFSLHLMFKDNTILMGTSSEDMIAIKNGRYNSKVGGKHKKIIKKNSSAIYVNGQEIATTFPREMMPSNLRKQIDFVSKNTKDVIFKTSKIKNNTLQGEMILNTPEKGHNNSFAYFLNMINALID